LNKKLEKLKKNKKFRKISLTRGRKFYILSIPKRKRVLEMIENTDISSIPERLSSVMKHDIKDNRA